MQKISKWIVNHMAVFVVLVGVVGGIFPDSLKWITPHVPFLLGVVMFGMGLTLTMEDVVRLLKRPKDIFLGAFLQFCIMPFVAFLVVKLFALPPALAIGVILVGTCPGGTASNVITFLAKGDVPLSVSMTMVTTLLAPIVTPFLTFLLAGATIEVSLTAMMLSIFKMVFFPVISGIFIAHFFPRFVVKALPYLPLTSTVVIVLLVGTVVSMSAHTLSSIGITLLFAVIVHNLAGMSLGYFAAGLTGMDNIKRRTISIEVGMQNSGMAAALALMYFEPTAGIPGALFSMWHNVSGSIFANYFTREAKKATKLSKIEA